MKTAAHIALGRTGEAIAAACLEQRGMRILHRNWRSGRYEIDLIAADEYCLHLVEVKTLRYPATQFPEQQVHKTKFRHWLQAADAFLWASGNQLRVQFDIVSVLLDQQGTAVEVRLFEDVFDW
jgi:putative endonuclease